MNMSASTVHIANQLPVFKSRDIYELKDYQELLKLLQKYHIQKFLLKSRDELYAYLDNCFKPPSPEKESSFHERESEQSEFENKSDSKQQKLENVKQQIVTQQYAKLEDDSRPQKMETVQPQKKQFLDNLKTLPQIQDFDEEDLKSMLKDLYQDENKNGGKKGHRKRQNLEMMKDDNSYKWPASRVRVVKGLAILIQQRIPYAKILQDFKIAYKTYSYTLFLKDTDDTANLIWSRIKEYGCEIPNMQFRTNQIELIYDMVKLVYEKRDYCRDQIMAICSGVVFQKKLKALKEKAEQKTKCDDIKVVQVTAYLDKINDFVQQGPAMSKYQNGPSECQYLQQKIIKNASKTLLYQTLVMGVPVPEILKFLSLRKTKQTTLNKAEFNSGLYIYIVPSVTFLKIITKKPGMESIASQLSIEDLDSLDLKRLDQFNYELSCGLKKLEENGDNILYSVLQLILQKLEEINHQQLSSIIDDIRFKILSQKLNEIYKEEIQEQPRNQQEISLFVGCVLNKIDQYVKANKQKPSSEQRKQICCIKIKKYLEYNIILRNDQQSVSELQLEQCKTLFMFFLEDISNKEIPFPECLPLFKLEKEEFDLSFDVKLVGIMLLSKPIRQYFITCMGMESELEKQTNGETVFINSIPLLDVEILNKQIPDLAQIFCLQVHILYEMRQQLKSEIKDLFSEGLMSPIMEQLSALQQDERDDALALAELRELKFFASSPDN